MIILIRAVVIASLVIVLSLPGLSQIQPFLKGVDVSFLPQIETNGGIFKDGGLAKDAMQIFKDHGFNYIRLRIWHTPADSASNLANTLILASRAKQQGFKLLLDFHYSDWWADPAHQAIPAAWVGVTFEALKESVFQYTRDVITALKNQNTLPDMVQVGNEISCGMLWNECNICGAYNTPAQWNKFGEILKSGIRGVKENLSVSDSVQIMIHTDRGTDNGACQWFFNHLDEEGVSFDIIGLSYYPWWHGTLSQLSANINDLAARYDKNIMVVETAYPWTLQWYDGENNIVGDSSQLHSGYPATPAGQQAFLADVISTVRGTPGNKGIGVMYWEPDWISAPTFNSPWENLSMFDFQGNALSSFQAFEPPQFQQEIRQGWNMISSSTLSFEQRKNVLYPGSSSAAFSYSPEGYVQEETLHHGVGYWLKFPSNQTVTISGDSLLESAIEVNAGWYMIGSLSVPAIVVDILQLPSNNIISGFYGYQSGYAIVDTLQPGKGYWVKMRQAGQLVLKRD